MKFNHQKLTIKEYHSRFLLMTIFTVSIIIISLLIYCNRIYNEKKENVKILLSLEAREIQNTLVSNIYYSKYFLKFLLLSINNGIICPKNITKTLESYKSFTESQYDDILFNWNKCSIINSNFKPISVDRNYHIDYLDNLKSFNFKPANLEVSNFVQNNNNFNLTYNIFSESNRQYRGSVVFSYDINDIVNKLKKIINDKHINFIITDLQGNIILKSQPKIKNITDKNGLTSTLVQLLRYNNFIHNDIFHFSLAHRKNYLIKRVNNLPLNVIISLDSNEISQYLIKELSKKFLELMIFGGILFLSMMYVYKRELFLRNNAERATLFAMKATKAKSDFLAFTAHEIRSPLGFIVTGSELMSQELFGELPPQYKSYADGIHNNSKIILEFIKDILDENKILEGKFKIINSVVDITEIINESIIINQTRFSNRLVSIEANLEKNLPHLISDKRRMIQIMNNLISNAIKYSKDESVVLVSSYITSDGLIVSIEDKGIGMSQEQVNMLLAVDMVNANDDYESYGLGFLIVKMLVEAHDGKLMIYSSSGVGTKITITFPKYKLIYTYHDNDEVLI